MKKKRIVLIGISLTALFLIVMGTTILAMNAKENEKVEKRLAPEHKEEQTITCVREKGHDDVEETETVYMQKGVLITRKNTASWYKAEAKEQTCTYYTTKNEGLNAKPGVTSSLDCNENRGNFTATYTIADMDKEDMKLKQFDYINNQNIFDYRAWMEYMRKDGYTCSENA